ncbi:response regulator [Guptibacillus algicola]|uniref:response regulator n=1 Tax=Guptibacillus algicola TaxID=225844 RepID=UPI001CD1E7B2|nr:response regulator [Alkalihalobacillus algicola]MCA0988669.1 response regulator [Alkalihalobacillus algicola]
MTTSILLIEDDPMVQEVNKQFIERIEGFQIIGVASTGEEGLKLVKEMKPDLILLDVYMPERNGLDMLKALRSSGNHVDVIAITAANDRETIRKMLHHGARDYLIKPFKFERFQQALKDYKIYNDQLSGEGTISQSELDFVKNSRSNRNDRVMEPPLPKGLNRQTLEQITSFLSQHTEPITAEETADGIGLARVTARRYLEFLQKSGHVKLEIQYGGVGRPLNRYLFVKKNTTEI